MFSKIFREYKDKKALRRWNNSAIGIMLAEHTKKYFSEYRTLLDLEEETKTRIIEGFYKSIFELDATSDPFLAMRELLTTYVLQYAQYEIIYINKDAKKELSYSDCPYISGELHNHIDKLVEHVEELKKLRWKHPDMTNDQLVSFCGTQGFVYLYYLNGMNYVRAEIFDDIDEEKDWFRPFVESMLIWQEEIYREAIGLPSLIDHGFGGLEYGIFMQFVRKGYQNPYYEWQKKYGKA